MVKKYLPDSRNALFERIINVQDGGLRFAGLASAKGFRSRAEGDLSKHIIVSSQDSA
jgi:hypothetical protein